MTRLSASTSSVPTRAWYAQRRGQLAPQYRAGAQHRAAREHATEPGGGDDHGGRTGAVMQAAGA